MMRIAVGALLMTAACTTGPVDAGRMPAGGPEEDRCNAAAAQSLVGRQASTELAVEARRRSGADMVRWLQPGQIVTMEYRYGRLNIKLDANNRVEAITCG